jgi:hypothetical protein
MNSKFFVYGRCERIPTLHFGSAVPEVRSTDVL